MLKFIVKRIIVSIPIFIGITLIVYILASLAPGGPIDIISGSANLSEAQVQDLEVQYGLDKPIIVRYGLWLLDLVHGDFGESTKTKQAVSALIGERIGPTMVLSMTSLVFSILFGVLLGIISAHKPYSIGDKIASFFAFIGNAMPSFFVALLLIYVFAVILRVLPASGMYGVGDHNIGNLASHIVLPALVIALQSIGGYIKQTRGAMLECTNEDYVKTARSKGISEWRITIRHVLRNALVPIVTQLGLSVPYIIGGSVVTEQIFGWPGIGSLMITSINGRDYNTIMGITVLIAIVVLACNIVLDVIYALLDPRIAAES